ncbi:MAG: hypothetical protein HS115_18330 [Spirochaetales bacterium]|nr:hypothetical protein [Spirochaetales bacterium]
MNRFLLFCVRTLEKGLDRWILWRLEPRFPVKTASAIVAAAALVTMTQFPGGIFPIDKTSPEKPFITEYKKKFPEGLTRHSDRLSFHCTERLSAGILARRLYSYSFIYDQRQLEEAIQKNNPAAFADRVCHKEEIVLPEPILQPHQNEPLGWPADAAVHAIYLQGGNSNPGRIQREVERLKNAGANGIVFDVKDIIGVVNYRSSLDIVEKNRRHPAPILDISKMIKYLHDNDIYVIARMALFQDENLAKQRPDLAIKDAGSPTGRLLTKGQPLWVDPGHQEVQDYNLALVTELVLLGVDEIQFDYVRYPAEGNLKQVSYHQVSSPEDKVQNIARFLAGAHTLTSLTNTRTAIDIFGVVAWGEDLDINATGQRIERLSLHVDVISPMLYPSHFSNGFDRKARPADEPYHFLHQGVARVLEKSGTGKVVRPWLQAFRWRVSNYNAAYIQEQIRGSDDAGGKGWMLWNAGNEYDMAFSAVTPVLRRRAVAAR